MLAKRDALIEFEQFNRTIPVYPLSQWAKPIIWVFGEESSTTKGDA